MTLNDFLNELDEDIQTRLDEATEEGDYESISCEVGRQSTLREIREWVEEHKASLEAPNGQIVTFVEVD